MCFLIFCGSVIITVIKQSVTLVESLHFSGIENMASWPPSKAGYGSAISDLRLEWDVDGGYVALDMSIV